MKISMIEMVSSHGGMNYYDYSLMKSLGKLGNEVTLYTSSPLLFNIDNNLHVDLCYEGMFDSKNKIAKLHKFIKGTRIALNKSRRNNVKVIHFQVFAITMLETYIVFKAKKMGFKVVVTVHDVESFNKENKTGLSKTFYNNVDKIIVHNQISYKTLASFLETIDNTEKIIEKCQIIPHGSYIGLLPDKISKKEAKEKFHINENDFTFLFFGQIKRVKGLDILLKAFSQLLQQYNSNVKLIIAGKIWKDDANIYNSIIAENNLSSHLIMDIKYIKDEDIVNYYSAADCIVLPYKKIFQSGVLLMAQSYRLPVIVSDLLGMTEIVSDEENGFIFKSESINDLEKTLEKVMQYPDLERIEKRAYDKLLKEYNWDLIAEKQANLMRELINE